MILRQYPLLQDQGFTLLEMLITLAITSLVMIGLGGVVGQALQTRDTMLGRQELTRQASFAMARMTAAARGTGRLLLPLGENPATAWSESVRDVLAVTLDPDIDRDGNGWADANNDEDYLDLNNNGSRDPGEPELIDEDVGNDNTNDAAHGIVGIDDDGDGFTDEGAMHASGTYRDNDEDGAESEDHLNGTDDDGDGMIDEDMPGDMNKDGQDGIIDFDDDKDGLKDEEPPPDDDEDGINDEDWFDPVVFFLSGTTLVERTPVNWDENTDATIDGLDFIENPLVENVSEFRVERLVKGAKKNTLVDITLTLAAGNDTITLQSRTRLGGSK